MGSEMCIRDRGIAIGFIPLPHLPNASANRMMSAVGIIFAGTALPEEILFRSLIQNLLMLRFGASWRLKPRRTALRTARAASLRKKICDADAKGSSETHQVQGGAVPYSPLDSTHVTTSDMRHVSQSLLGQSLALSQLADP